MKPEYGVVGGGLERNGPWAPEAELRRSVRLQFEVGVADVEGHRRIVDAAGEQLRRAWRALDILRGDAADEAPAAGLEEADGRALGREARVGSRLSGVDEEVADRALHVHLLDAAGDLRRSVSLNLNSLNM